MTVVTQKEKIDIAITNLAKTIKKNLKRWHEFGVNVKTASENLRVAMKKNTQCDIAEIRLKKGNK